MVSDFSPQEARSADAADSEVGDMIARRARKAHQKVAQRARAEAAATSKAVRRATKAESRAAELAAKQSRKTAATDSKHRRAETKAARKAAKAARKAAKAEAKAVTAAAAAAKTRPARIMDRLTDPKVAKRAVSIGKIVVPAVAPVALTAAAGTRRYVDRRRADQLGVPVEKVAQYRGPTGPTGARIDGLTAAIDDLASRKGSDLQATRFAEVAGGRLKDLTAAVQAAASMPSSKRRRVLRAVGRELDGIDADLVSHLMADGTGS